MSSIAVNTIRGQYAKIHKFASKNLTGVCPVYKPKGLHWKDLEDLIRITIEFDLGWNLGQLGINTCVYPRLRSTHEGLTNVFFGSYAKNLQNIKHASISADLTCKLGERNEIFHRKQQVMTPVDEDNFHSDDEDGLINEFEDVNDGIEAIKQNNDKNIRNILTVTNDELEKVVLSYLGEFEQVKAPLERVVRTFLTAKNERWDRFGDYLQPKQPTRSFAKFYEGQQPYLVNVNWMTRPKLVDEIGLKLGTTATIERCIFTSFGDLITSKSALAKHQLYLEEIVSNVRRNKLLYSFVLSECNKVGRDTKTIFRSPW